MATVNAGGSSARLASHVLIAIGVATLCTVLLTVLMTAQQLSMSMGDQTPRLSVASAFVRGLIFFSPWVVLAPAITLLGWYQRLGTGHLAWRVPVWILAIVIACVVDPVIMTALTRLLGVGPSSEVQTGASFLSAAQVRFTQTIALNLVLFLIAALLYHALVYYSAYRDRSRREAALEVELARFRLYVLQQQLQPHFLFNALHTVSALMSEDVVIARRVLAQLGDLLRTALDRMDEQDIALEQEIEFLRGYVAIQTARFGDRLTVEWAVDDAARSIPVPNMILQPCLENAIQHGIEPLEGGGTVTVAAHVSGASLHLDITDNGRGAVGNNGRVAGRGLKNVRERLEARYGERQSFEAGNVPGGGFRVRIVLPR
ncbi:MAG TPA: histidine kinase [Gemmatimonadales bacterium]|nr:histidine kinase [Gemmatimonadales bacterium]